MLAEELFRDLFRLEELGNEVARWNARQNSGALHIDRDLAAANIVNFGLLRQGCKKANLEQWSRGKESMYGLHYVYNKITLSK